MSGYLFQTSDGRPVPAVTAGQMRHVDRIAEDVFGLGVLQMMENAGRDLALSVLEMLAGEGARLPSWWGRAGMGAERCAAHATIGIPPQLYQRLEMQVELLFGGRYVIPLERVLTGQERPAGRI